MNTLDELSYSFYDEETKQFKKYLTHKSNLDNRKDLHTLNKILKEGTCNTRQAVTEVYGTYNASTFSAYRMLRLRLKKNLEDFIYQQVRKDDTPMNIHKLISVARFLHLRKKHSLSWKYLQKAEKIAVHAEEYQLLDRVYQFMTEYAWTQAPGILDQVLKKESENKKEVHIIRSFNSALSVILSELNQQHINGNKPNIEKIINNALSRFGIQQILLQKASHYYKLAMLIKVSLEEKNDYAELFTFMSSTLKEMEKARLFNKHNYLYKIELLNIICYSAAGAGDYVTAEKYLNIIEEENKAYPDTELLSIRAFMTKAIHLLLTNRFTEAINVLEELKIKYKKLYQYDDQFFSRLNCNLASAHMHLDNIRMARKYVQELLNHSKRILRSFGIVDLFYCHATICFLAIEAKDYEFASFRIKSIERKFKQLLQKKHNKRKAAFLKLLKSIVTDPNAWEKNKFRNEAWNFILMHPLYQPGIEFISFNTWVYSKLKKVDYNEGEYIKIMEKEIKNKNSMNNEKWVNKIKAMTITS